ncbi:hypothetical protein [uncultured Gimesia sp.]|uniref:hypothetical protein n=1 Tax=uncultured Gimesia sp. TaxID=1678688 RepID=UPI0030DD4EF9
MTTIDTHYANTDFDLKSASSFDTLHRELSSRCFALFYTHGEDGHYHACFESDHDGETPESGADRDILLIVNAINMLSDSAKAELDLCYLREFNIGFHCGDSWAFVHSIPHKAVAAASNVGCSLAVTLYPMRQPDGTPRE